MAHDFSLRCVKCGMPGVEVIDEWVSTYCPHCNDKMIEHSNEQREWDYYHPTNANTNGERQ